MMKKYVLLIICLLLLCGCEFDVLNNLEEVPVQNLIFDKDKKEDTPKYVDDNPVKISLYTSGENATVDKVPEKLDIPWVKKKDITVLNIILTDEEYLNFNYFQDIWKKYADTYEKKYKVGWYLSFNLSDGTKIEQMIFSPKYVEYFYDYLEIYLYDSANVAKDVWYSHLLEKDMNDDVILTSMKLTAGSKYEEIVSPITVMGFTYDSDDDFDENGNYRGNSKYIVNIYNESL